MTQVSSFIDSFVFALKQFIIAAARPLPPPLPVQFKESTSASQLNWHKRVRFSLQRCGPLTLGGFYFFVCRLQQLLRRWHRRLVRPGCSLQLACLSDSCC